MVDIGRCGGLTLKDRDTLVTARRALLIEILVKGRCGGASGSQNFLGAAAWHQVRSFDGICLLHYESFADDVLRLLV